MISLNVYNYGGCEHFTNMPFLANMIMANDEQDEKNEHSDSPALPPSMGQHWGSGKGSGRTKLFAREEDFDIYCDRNQGVNYIFHGCPLDCTIDHLEYNPDTMRITVFTTDGQKMDLGTKIQWLVRPYIAKDQYLFIVRTENGESIEGLQVPLRVITPSTSIKDHASTQTDILN